MRRAVLLPLCAIVVSPGLACVVDSDSSSFAPFAAGDDGIESSGSGDGAAGLFGSDQYADSGNGFDDDSTSDGTDEENDDPIKFDLSDPEAAAENDAPCGVDILFVIDNSGSMSQHKNNIVEAFDNFIDEMVAALNPGTPVHVAVTRATGFFAPGNGSGWSEPSCVFGYLDGVWNPPDQSDNGINGQQGRLYENDGKRYFEYQIGEDTTMLGQWFEHTLMGAIALDDASNSESVVAAAAYPFHPANAEHNAGFLRDKAVLVLFLLSDAPDASPVEVATDDLIAMVSDAKAGCGDGCVLPTGIVQSYCYGNPLNDNSRLTDFMNAFGGPPPAIDFFNLNMPPESFSSVLGATLAESIAYTCEYVVPAG